MYDILTKLHILAIACSRAANTFSVKPDRHSDFPYALSLSSQYDPLYQNRRTIWSCKVGQKLRVALAVATEVGVIMMVPCKQMASMKTGSWRLWHGAMGLPMPGPGESDHRAVTVESSLTIIMGATHCRGRMQLQSSYCSSNDVVHSYMYQKSSVFLSLPFAHTIKNSISQNLLR